MVEVGFILGYEPGELGEELLDDGDGAAHHLF